FGRERVAASLGRQPVPGHQIHQREAADAASHFREGFSPRTAKVLHGLYANSFKLNIAWAKSASRSRPPFRKAMELAFSDCDGRRPSANWNARVTWAAASLPASLCSRAANILACVMTKLLFIIISACGAMVERLRRSQVFTRFGWS